MRRIQSPMEMTRGVWRIALRQPVLKDSGGVTSSSIRCIPRSASALSISARQASHV
ncbi:MAG: hypothetical protein ACLR07_10340 [Christensenellales bacterium]